MSGSEVLTSEADTPAPSLPLFLEQAARIAKLEREREKLEREKLVLLDRIADLKRELLFAGLGIRLTDVDKS